MIKKSFVGSVLRETKPFHMVMFVYLFMVVVENLFALSLPYLIGKSTDAIVSNQGFDVFINYFILGVVLLVASKVFGLLFTLYENSNFTFKFEKFLMSKTVGKVLTFSIGQVRNENSGMTQSVVTRGQGKLFELIFNFVYGVFPSTVKTFVAVFPLLSGKNKKLFCNNVFEYKTWFDHTTRCFAIFVFCFSYQHKVQEKIARYF